MLSALTIGIVIASVAGLAAITLIESPGQVAARAAAPAPSVITAAARWGVLRAAITVGGIVRARTVDVTAQVPFTTRTVTRMPVKVGDRVWPGHVIAEIDGRPIVLLRGRLPAYRDLREGDHGPDVTQLQADLEGLGYADYDEDGYFGPSTALALLLLYDHLGYTAPIYHPRLHARHGGAAGDHAGGGDARIAPAIAGRHTATVPLTPSAYLPKGEVAYIPARSALVTAVNARVGSRVGTGTVLSLATGRPYVTGALSADQASAARSGIEAQIVAAIPALTARGTVTRVSPMPAAGAHHGSRYPIWVRIGSRLPQRVIGTQVRLTLWAPVTSGPVLTVPVTSIFAGRGKRAYVIRVTAAGRQRVPIDTGPSADGLVAVQPAGTGGLRPGDRVLIGLRR